MHTERQCIDAVEKIVAAAKHDVGGVEYITDDRDVAPFSTTSTRYRTSSQWSAVIGFDPHCSLSIFSNNNGGRMMRYGYWLPVFGAGCETSRTTDEASWDYASRLPGAVKKSLDLALVAELNLNDIKGRCATLDAWSTARHWPRSRALE